jgi:hypothetical protein
MLRLELVLLILRSVEEGVDLEKYEEEVDPLLQSLPGLVRDLLVPIFSSTIFPLILRMLILPLPLIHLGMLLVPKCTLTVTPANLKDLALSLTTLSWLLNLPLNK